MRKKVWTAILKDARKVHKDRLYFEAHGDSGNALLSIICMKMGGGEQVFYLDEKDVLKLLGPLLQWIAHRAQLSPAKRRKRSTRKKA